MQRASGRCPPRHRFAAQANRSSRHGRQPKRDLLRQGRQTCARIPHHPCRGSQAAHQDPANPESRRGKGRAPFGLSDAKSPPQQAAPPTVQVPKPFGVRIYIFVCPAADFLRNGCKELYPSTDCTAFCQCRSGFPQCAYAAAAHPEFRRSVECRSPLHKSGLRL